MCEERKNVLGKVGEELALFVQIESRYTFVNAMLGPVGWGITKSIIGLDARYG